MLFNSKEFLLLFVATFVLYYLPWTKGRQVVLLIASSLVFYAYGQPMLLILLLSSIALNTYTSHKIVQNSQHSTRKSWATFGVAANLGIIVFFKYSGMLSHSLGLDTNNLGQFLLQLPLPLGISFFTFEGISLVVDAYKERETDQYHSFVVQSIAKHGANTLLFVSFFPHLIAGPILKANEFYPQIRNGKHLGDIQWDTAFRQLVAGFFLKMVVADNLKDQTFWIAYPYFLNSSTETLLLMLFGYSVQIFADFAGYSLIALGLATLLGYQLKGNFNFPYIASSFSDFWRRWHISLSSFLREYLYIPLGGNRKGKMRTYANLMATMVLGGLWHGAAWSYATWGFAHGLFLALERLFNDYVHLRPSAFLALARWLLVFVLVTFAWLLFKLPNIGHVFSYLHAIANNLALPSEYKRNWLILVYASPIVGYHLWAWARERGYGQLLHKLEWPVYGLMLFLLAVNSGSSADFIYFQF